MISDRLIDLAASLKRRFGHLAYDAALHDSEVYYAQIYLEHIRKQLSTIERPSAKPLRILDVGCGSGRFLIPLAKDGHHLTGIDYHPDSINVLKNKLKDHDLNADLRYGDLLKVLPGIPEDSFDAIICLEVLYTSPDRVAATRSILKLLRSGGAFLITHKPPAYFLLQSLRNGNVQDALLVQNQSSGRLTKGHHRVFYNWQTLEQIQQIYREVGGLISSMHPIGPYSGFSVDPFSDICDPGSLDDERRALLAQLEKEAPDFTLQMSRYILVAGTKEGRASAT